MDNGPENSGVRTQFLKRMVDFADQTEKSIMLSWAKMMKWKGIPPIINLSQKIYHKGISLTKTAMEEIEMRLLRNPHLPKWDILIRPC